ncbi:MAG: efflux RND transporter periplasmic adaptor subunit [Betaproteobacteria bacterium]
MDSTPDTPTFPAPGRPARPRRSPAGWIALVAVVSAFGAAWLFGIVPRQNAREALARETRELAVPTVAVLQPERGDGSADLVLPGNLQPHAETAIHARASGYLKRWTAEIGTAVKAGDLLAEIDIPEVDAQLQQARADLATARVQFEQAQRTSSRWQELVRTGAVTAQDAETALSTMRARRSAMDAAQQNVARYEKLQSFRKVVAPFSGVITARNADLGDLVDAGSGSGTARELFRLSATDRLRVQVNIPQAAARAAVPGTVAEISLAEFPGRRFPGRLVRTARSIDRSSRTLLAEVDVDNAAGELLPGAYAQVRLKLPSGSTALVVPVNTLLFRAEGPQVAVVGKDGRIALRSVTIGRDFGTRVELLSGLDPADAVVVNPSDAIAAGTQVRVVKAATPKAAG